jgi:proteasome lid subunit RPN8/RPN11
MPFVNMKFIKGRLLGQDTGDAVTMSAELCLSLLNQARQIHYAGLKAYGLLIAEPDRAGYPFTATDVVFLDSRKNRRNDSAYRAAFHAQGEYFRQFDDAGFVADPAELLAVWQDIEDSGRQVIAPFHSHRRQPANFSLIDYRLHNPAFPWHMIISLRDPQRPVLQPFAVHKQLSDFGISDRDTCQDSQLSYPGPEVRPLTLAAYGPPQAVRQLTIALAADWQLGASGRQPAADRTRDASGMKMARTGAAQPALTEPSSTRCDQRGIR